MSETAPPCVLIVEDESTIVANLVEYLEARGLAVDSAHDGAAAMAWVSSDTYDVIVVDLGLPPDDAYSCCSACGAGSRSPRRGSWRPTCAKPAS